MNSPERSLDMTRDLFVRREPHARPRLHVRHEPVEHGDARSMADDVRVHRQDEQSALLVRAVEFHFPARPEAAFRLVVMQGGREPPSQPRVVDQESPI